METIKTATTAIQERIWGSPPRDEPEMDKGQEPMSGVKGEGTATDPYDSGNATGMLWCLNIALLLKGSGRNCFSGDAEH